jgi:hypothetical protein
MKALALRRATPLAVAIALALQGAPARAAGDPDKQAQALFLEAMKLMAKKQYAEACDKLAQSHELDPGMGSEFRLAECYEKLGRMASAYARYVSVAEQAKAAGKPDREAVARKRAAALETKVARLTILIPPAVASLPGIEVARDGAIVDPTLWGAAVPVDPGDHIVNVRAPKKIAFEGKVWAEPAAKLTVAVAALESVPPPPDPDARGPKSNVPTIVLGSAGAVAMVLAATFAGVRASKIGSAHTIHDRIDAASGNCVNGGKPAAEADDCAALAAAASAGDRMGSAAIVSVTLGGAALLGMGAYLLLPPPKIQRPRDAALRWAPAVGPDHAGVVAWGSF